MAPSEFEIRAGGAHAVVTGVGAGLRAFTVDGAHHVETYEGDPPMGAGCVLIPWPNRTAGARFDWAGTPHELEVTEPANGNAIHGLVRKRPWTLVEHTDDTVTLAIDVPGGDDEQAHGWPQPLHVETTYTVAPTGLTVTHVLTNTGDGAVPAGVGTHPYLRVGDHPSGDCTLQVPTTTVLDVDERQIPVGAARPVTDDENLRQPRRVADLELDTCFGVRPGVAGVLAELVAPDGTGTRLWGDRNVAWVQAFTPGSPFGREGKAVAVEPMTCPPDALNSGTDLVVLQPGATWTVRWGLEAVR
ncbi:aldose 1-epimerase family protein [Actinomycetospora corticicola]|uniref:Aldose 1-epimerase n=1 Tax=Actinomycetospora corticicola TaxID=663602 RepID=A0A7Y9DXG5_9PSEU|nr:aldose 1-epimerase family protein [Actinomycetospora corticicola]NYD37256.1 aldose 1-epimerase [Actinomycetospora corticicola]